MHVINISDVYDNYTSSIYTDYDNIFFAHCTNKQHDNDIIIPTLLLTIPCGLSYLCLMSLVVYILNKLFFNIE